MFEQIVIKVPLEAEMQRAVVLFDSIALDAIGTLELVSLLVDDDQVERRLVVPT